MQTYPWLADTATQLRHLQAHLPHAVLLHGSAGLGKRSLAIAFAHRLLCEKPTDVGACGQCDACYWLALGNHPDVLLVEPEQPEDAADGIEKRKTTHISIDQVRALTDFLHTSAHRGGARIVVLHPAEALNTAAANALLKTLEEPPARSVLILVSHQRARLLPTVLSRCHQVRVIVPDAALSMQWLSQQAIPDAALCLALAGGAPVQAVALSPPELQAERRACLIELSQPEHLAVVELAEKYAKLDTQGLLRWLIWLQQWSDDLISQRMAARIGYHIDFVDVLRALAARMNVQQCFKFQQRLLEARRAAYHPLNTQMVVEDVLLAYCALF